MLIMNMVGPLYFDDHETLRKEMGHRSDAPDDLGSPRVGE